MWNETSFDAAWPLLPVWLLLAVVAHHRWRVYKHHQSPWKGGGFGMFSDISPSSVAAILTVREADGSLTELRVEVGDWMNRFNVIPTERNLRKWGNQILVARWRRSGDSAVPFVPDRGDPLHVCRVTLRHFKIEFDGRTGRHAARPQRTVTLDRTAADGRRP